MSAADVALGVVPLPVQLPAGDYAEREKTALCQGAMQA